MPVLCCLASNQAKVNSYLTGTANGIVDYRKPVRHFVSNHSRRHPGQQALSSAMRSSPVIEISPPSSGTAIFQHNPKGDATLRREWEPGCQPDELYDAFLPAWRASLRGLLVRRLRNESTQMADWQKRVRSEARDRYFYWTAVFGSKCSFFCIICNPHHCAKFETC